MAKKSFTKEGSPFMVGALARMNLKFDQYHRETKALAREKGLSPPQTNPFYNNVAQALELYDGMLECLRLLSVLRPENKRPAFKIREGTGRAVTEAPRGLLMHHYEINKKGFIEKADLVTPTSHNFANLEDDLRLLVSRFSGDDGPALGRPAYAAGPPRHSPARGAEARLVKGASGGAMQPARAATLAGLRGPPRHCGDDAGLRSPTPAAGKRRGRRLRLCRFAGDGSARQ